ncbi:MAG TPA: hypothetical protein VEX86_05225 [Longimicrobium sp.]|nr:hypothetical protein [Longimicrobium sp.]
MLSGLAAIVATEPSYRVEDRDHRWNLRRAAASRTRRPKRTVSRERVSPPRKSFIRNAIRVVHPVE